MTGASTIHLPLNPQGDTTTAGAVSYRIAVPPDDIFFLIQFPTSRLPAVLQSASNSLRRCCFSQPLQSRTLGFSYK